MLVYEEGSLIKRSIRDLYSRDIDEVLVDGERGYREAKDYMKMLMPSHARNVKQYADPLPLFSRFQVEGYLSAMFNPVVQLKSGGYIVIDTTEALVAIDVNSGRSTREASIEDTALRTNLEAAEEAARQMRLRDLAGLMSTLTPDCVYQLFPGGHTWRGHEGATRFYTHLLSAIPDVHFDLTNIVIGPQGVFEEAQVTGTHREQWLDVPPSGAAVEFTVTIFFPWNREQRLFEGERVHYHSLGSDHPPSRS